MIERLAYQQHRTISHWNQISPPRAAMVRTSRMIAAGLMANFRAGSLMADARRAARGDLTPRTLAAWCAIGSLVMLVMLTSLF